MKEVDYNRNKTRDVHLWLKIEAVLKLKLITVKCLSISPALTSPTCREHFRL